MTQQLSFLATCPVGLGPLLLEELAALGALSLRETPSGVYFTGPLAVAYRACLWSRLANRVLVRISETAVSNAAAPQAADALKFSPEYLQKFGVVDRVISEPMGGAHRDFDLAAKALKDAIVDSLAKLKKKSTKKLLEDRYTRFRHLGDFAETETSAKP